MAVFLKDGEVLSKKTAGMKIKIKKKGGGGRLKIGKVKMDHAGVYTCQATNLAGTANYSYTLNVWKGDEVPDEDYCIPCPKEKENFCVHGRCCLVVGQAACRCFPKYKGTRCNEKEIPLLRNINAIEARYHQQTVAIMAVCIALLVVILICYAVYCKFKKSRSRIRKQIIARNGHVGGRQPDAVSERVIADANTAGILGDDSSPGKVEMTGYRSTNLTETPSHPTAFSQRPQTYDDVILTGAAEAQPLVHQDEHSGYRSKRDELRQMGLQANGKRKRKRGVAIGLPGDQSRSTSDMDAPKGQRRVDELKSGQNSMSSSASSLASHDLRKPVIPLDERFKSLLQSGEQRPPAYPTNHREDVPDSAGHPEFQSPPVAEIVEEVPNQSSMPSPRLGSTNSPINPVGREHAPSTASSGSTHRVTTFDTDGRIEEETLGRDEGPLQSVTPHSPSLSPDSLHHHLPRADHIPKSPSLASPSPNISGSQLSPRGKFQYQNKDSGVNVYPYYEHNPDRPRNLSASRHDSDDVFSGMELPDAPLMYDSQRGSQPASPRLYQTSPEMSMGVPYRHAPVTVASARTHHLPLLTKEKPELAPIDQMENRLMAGSTVSLSSSDQSSPEKNRNSHKIEV